MAGPALALALVACDGAEPVRVNETFGSGGDCTDYVTPDGFTCCCGQSTCSRTPVCSHGDARARPIPVRETGGIPSTSGSGGWSSAGAGAGESGGSSGRGTYLIPLSDGGSVLFDTACPAIAGPDAWAPEAHIGAGPTTIYGCCRPNGQCGLITSAVNLGPLMMTVYIAPFLGCVSYAELTTIGLGLCDGGAPARSDGHWYPTSCYTVPEDPNQSCDYSIGAKPDDGGIDGANSDASDASPP